MAELSDAYRFKIYQLAFRYLRNKEDAEEVTQDVLFKVYRNIGDVPRRRGALIVDLSHHVQRGDVAAANRALSAVSGRRPPYGVA